MARHAEITQRTGGGHLHLRLTNPVAARLQQKHQRSDPLDLPKGKDFFGRNQEQLDALPCN